jgi:hypothetical protein
MRRSLIALVLVSLLPACGNDNKKTNTTPTSANTIGPTVGQLAAINISATPVLVPAVASSTPGFQWQISWTLSLQETAGVSATLTEVDVVMDNGVLTFGPSALSAQGGTQLASKGTLTLNQSVAYTLSNGGRLATVVIVAFLTDSNGNHIQVSTQIRIV